MNNIESIIDDSIIKKYLNLKKRAILSVERCFDDEKANESYEESYNDLISILYERAKEKNLIDNVNDENVAKSILMIDLFNFMVNNKVK